MSKIDKLTIQGFKSIRLLDKLQLKNLNVLIGANGVGKSNFVSYFKMLHELVEGRLQVWTSKQGGADRVLTFGLKETSSFSSTLLFGRNGYHVVLEPTTNEGFTFVSEKVHFKGDSVITSPDLGSGHMESLLKEHTKPISKFCYSSISSWKVFHFHDTSDTAAVKRAGAAHDNEYLRPDAGNLAAYLFKLQRENPDVYAQICKTVRLAVPFFDDFVLKPVPLASGEEQIRLLWKQADSDYPLWPSQLSDGSIRFICLVTALLQPNPPSTIIIDEPELGLHPYAITLLGALLRSASKRMQVIVSTQSVPLLNEFELDDLIVVEREEGASIFKRLDADKFRTWLDDYSVGGAMGEKHHWWETIKMTIVHVICEGQTEEAFVKELLVEPFALKGIYLMPGLIGRPGHKGGNFKFERLVPDIEKRLLADQQCYCTTFFDFYGLPESFPGKNAVDANAPVAVKAQTLQNAFTEKLTERIGANAMRRFIPYVQMYEFEALLFSDPIKMAQGMDRVELETVFTEIANSFDSPEHINNSPQTAPSKRIENHIFGYEKPLLGTLAALDVGLETMREKCPLFNAWLTNIEALA